MAPLLKVQNLTVAVKKNGKLLTPVNDISFSINNGEIVGLSGESGCGKSMTALSIVNLLSNGVSIHSGEIIYNNQNLASLSEKEMCGIRGKEISIIFQEARQSLNPLMRVGNQITETLLLTAEKDSETDKTSTLYAQKQHGETYKTHALEMLKVLGFEEPEKIYDSYPHQLSGGMCQRVMTAIAAISCPRLLLADEPSSSLDLESQERILNLLVKMNNDFNASVLIISHDLSIIRKYCNRFLVMYAGKIVEEGPAGVLFSPLHPYTRALTEAIPSREKHGKNLENIPGKVPSIEDHLSGCPFAPRCKKTHKVCLETFPVAIETDRGQRVHCYFPHTGETDA